MKLNESKFTKTDDGLICFTGRESLGIRVYLNPEIVDDDGDMQYTLWMIGKIGRIIHEGPSGMAKMYLEDDGKEAAKVMAFDPMAVAKVHGIKHCFEMCPACNVVQKAFVNCEGSNLTCHLCGMTWNYQGRW